MSERQSSSSTQNAHKQPGTLMRILGNRDEPSNKIILAFQKTIIAFLHLRWIVSYKLVWELNANCKISMGFLSYGLPSYQNHVMSLSLYYTELFNSVKIKPHCFRRACSHPIPLLAFTLFHSDYVNKSREGKLGLKSSKKGALLCTAATRGARQHPWGCSGLVEDHRCWWGAGMQAGMQAGLLL